jgi:hypothetical protein
MLPVLADIKVDLTNLEAIPPLLALVVEALLEGRLDAKTGHAVCHSIHLGLRLYELGNLGAKMERIERLLEAERNRKPHQSEVEDMLHFEP